MTDGNDDSSLLNTNADPVGTLVTLAQTNQVQIFCVAFGNDVNTNALQQLTSQTGGQYYLAATTADLALQFQKIVKDIDGQYLLRWATLKRTRPALPAVFQVTSAASPPALTRIFSTRPTSYDQYHVDTNQTPPVTNITITTNITSQTLSLPFNPPTWAGDVRVGSLRLVPDADVGPQTIRLRATYVPRYMREIQLNYRPNYPCTAQPGFHRNQRHSLWLEHDRDHRHQWPADADDGQPGYHQPAHEH